VLEDRPLSIERLPTLTEVLNLGPEFAPAPTFTEAAAPAEAEASLPLLIEEVDRLEPAFADALTEGALVPQESDADSCEVVPGELPPADDSTFFAQGVVDVEHIVFLVLQRLQPHVDELLQKRLAEVLAPALARASESLIRESRVQLSATLRDLVQESLAQVLRDLSRTER